MYSLFQTGHTEENTIPVQGISPESSTIFILHKCDGTYGPHAQEIKLQVKRTFGPAKKLQVTSYDFFFKKS